MQQRQSKTYKLVLIGILSALVFFASMASVQLGDLTRFHLGNIVCLLSGIFFGPLVGGLSAGIGSMLYDFTNPLFMPEFWITFIMKFAMAFVAGLIARHLPAKTPMVLRYSATALMGSVLYTVLYLTKTFLWQHFIGGNTWQAAWVAVLWPATVSSITGVITIVVTTLLAPPIGLALQQAGLYHSPQQKHHPA